MYLKWRNNLVNLFPLRSQRPCHPRFAGPALIYFLESYINCRSQGTVLTGTSDSKSFFLLRVAIQTSQSSFP